MATWSLEVVNEAMKVNSLPSHKKLWLGSVLGSLPLRRRHLSQDYCVDLFLLEVDDLEESTLPLYTCWSSQRVSRILGSLAPLSLDSLTCSRNRGLRSHSK